jgi:hypothetical protein
MSKKKIRKRFMVCKEVQFGRYELVDCGAIHTKLKEAKKHALCCADGRSHIFVLPIYSVE